MSESGSDVYGPSTSNGGVDNKALFVVDIETEGPATVCNGGASGHRVTTENNNNKSEDDNDDGDDDDMDDGHEMTLDEAEEHQTPVQQQQSQPSQLQQQSEPGRCTCCAGLLGCWRRCVAESRQTLMEAKECISRIHRRRLLCRLCSMETLKKRLPCVEWIPKYR